MPGGVILKDSVICESDHQNPNKSKTFVLFANWVMNHLLIMIYDIIFVLLLELVPVLKKTSAK